MHIDCIRVFSVVIGCCIGRWSHQTVLGQWPVNGVISKLCTFFGVSFLQCVWSICLMLPGQTRMQFVGPRRRSPITAVSSRAALLSWRLLEEPRSHWRGSVWSVKTDTTMTSTHYRQGININISLVSHGENQKCTFMIAHILLCFTCFHFAGDHQSAGQ